MDTQRAQALFAATVSEIAKRPSQGRDEALHAMHPWSAAAIATIAELRAVDADAVEHAMNLEAFSVAT